MNSGFRSKVKWRQCWPRRRTALGTCTNGAQRNWGSAVLRTRGIDLIDLCYLRTARSVNVV